MSVFKEIHTVTFCDNVKVGFSSQVESYMQQGRTLDGYRYRIELDDDPRFLRLIGVHIEKPKDPEWGSIEQLIPLTSVTGIIYKKQKVDTATKK